MSNTETNGEKSIPSSKKPKLMSGDTSLLHLDGIPPDMLTKVETYLEPFRLSLDKLQEVSARLEKELIRGLGKHTHHRASVKMLPTFVRATPDGTEKGDFLALDLGGTNFRVLHVRVVEEEQKMLKVDSEICAIPQEIMQGTGEQLFNHIATCLSEFLDSQNLKGQTLPLGFTFSFPCEQKEIDKSILIRWTKGFKCSGVEGKDVVKLLKEAIQRRGDYEIGSVAMVNDTVGTMMSCGYRDQSCEIGMIIGTGTNACYMEEMKNVKRVEGEDGQMCINTEWGGFGDDGSLKDILTGFDSVVDEKSINPGVHIFEKMISGMYLGEIVRLVLVRLTEDKLLFNGQTSEALLTQGKFETRFISEIEHQDSGLENTQRILTSLGLDWNEVDARVVLLVCDTISSRSARLCAAALATIANRIRVNRGLDHLKTTVGVDGTVYKKHPNFSEELQAAVRLLAPECDITFLVSEDGSGKGAAMVTAVAQRLALQSRLHLQVDKCLEPFRLSRVKLQEVSARLENDLIRGLGTHTHHSAPVKMLPTFVRATPDGTDKGDFLAVDLGGTNLRVLHIRLDGSTQVQIMSQKESAVPEAIMEGTGEELFKFIADCLSDLNLKGRTLPLGFCFSFPCEQKGIDESILISWSKGFKCSGVVGEDVAELLRKAIKDREDYKIGFVAMANDTVGTMMSCGYTDPPCEIGMIIGTGTNACYMEEMKNVERVEGEDGRMCINTEWGGFGDDGSLKDILTGFDSVVDEKSINPGVHIFEKMISGMYLGEIVRLVLVRLTEDKLLFKGQTSEALLTQGKFETRFISEIEHQDSGLENARRILTSLGLDWNEVDARVVLLVCETISSRSACLCAAALATIANHIRVNRGLDHLKTTVGVDGAVYRMHPNFSKKLKDEVPHLAPKCDIKFMVSQDSSGVGAAMVAAVVQRLAHSC
ncbi:hexokinase-2-like [Parambassis ranga]|uniref:hexokinase n=1 Tax=Parambassis ranga TaxID=210632 RepID=A0A6P7JMF6_9TELE|nr:hexokinase-2-like [Parambassis ranga]